MTHSALTALILALWLGEMDGALCFDRLVTPLSFLQWTFQQLSLLFRARHWQIEYSFNSKLDVEAPDGARQLCVQLAN